MLSIFKGATELVALALFVAMIAAWADVLPALLRVVQ